MFFRASRGVSFFHIFPRLQSIMESVLPIAFIISVDHAKIFNSNPMQTSKMELFVTEKNVMTENCC